jgi:TRAP-type C4-dicarboxylate transport system permease small subunit
MKKLYATICKAEVFTAALCFSISCLLIFLAAIARTLDHPINWSQDMSLFLFAWSVFLSADAALREDRLVNIDLLVIHFSERTRKCIAIATYLIILVFLAVLFYYGLKLSLFSHRRVFQGIPGFSYTWVILSVPVGSFLQGITVILKLKGLMASLHAAGGGKTEKAGA